MRQKLSNHVAKFIREAISEMINERIGGGHVPPIVKRGTGFVIPFDSLHIKRVMNDGLDVVEIKLQADGDTVIEVAVDTVELNQGAGLVGFTGAIELEATTLNVFLRRPKP